MRTSLPKRVVRSLAGPRVMRLLAENSFVILEARNRLVFWPQALVAKRFEHREVARLRGVLKKIPQSEVATIMVTYRRPEMLLKAVESALAQTVSDHVIVIVDDGGGLPELPDDSRIFAVSLSEHCGVLGVLRNVGIRVSKSTYIAFLDDDNEWERNHLEAALEALNTGSGESRPDIAYTDVTRMLAGGAVVDVLADDFDRDRFAQKGGIDINSVVVRRSHETIFSRIDRPRNRFPKDDWEFIFRLTRKLPIRHVPVKTVRYLVHHQSYFTNWGTITNTGEA